VTGWLKVEPIFIPFKIALNAAFSTSQIDSNSLKLNHKIKYSKAKLEALVLECIEIKKLTFVETIIKLGVSLTTVLRLCRTLKIGRYSDQIPSEIRSNSSQQPYG